MNEIKIKKKITYEGYISITRTKNNDFDIQLKNESDDYFSMVITFEELALVRDRIIEILNEKVSRK